MLINFKIDQDFEGPVLRPCSVSKKAIVEVQFIYFVRLKLNNFQV